MIMIDFTTVQREGLLCPTGQRASISASQMRSTRRATINQRTIFSGSLKRHLTTTSTLTQTYSDPKRWLHFRYSAMMFGAQTSTRD